MNQILTLLLAVTMLTHGVAQESANRFSLTLGPNYNLSSTEFNTTDRDVEQFIAEQLIAERKDGTPIGFVQIIDPHREETRYWGNLGPHKRAIGIWIGEAKNLGRGYGTEMMHLALERCFADSLVTEVLLDPLVTNVLAIRFYRRLGFRFVAERTFDADQCAVYVLAREYRA